MAARGRIDNPILGVKGIRENIFSTKLKMVLLSVSYMATRLNYLPFLDRMRTRAVVCPTLVQVN